MLIDLKIKEFVADVASDLPAPGGGSVAALTAALGTALISMLANLTIDKKGYEAVSGKMQEFADHTTLAAERFLDAIDEDKKAFETYMDAIRLPKDTQDERAARAIAMQKAAKKATNVPLMLAKDAYSLMDLAIMTTAEGNKNATSDGAIAVVNLRCAVLTAIFNVRINLGVIKDEEFVNRVKKEADDLERLAKEKETKFLQGLVL